MVQSANSARFGEPLTTRIERVSGAGGDGDKGHQSGPTGAELLGLGLAFAVAVLLPLALGIGLDGLLHSSPVGLLIGLLLGVTAAATTVFQRFKKYL